MTTDEAQHIRKALSVKAISECRMQTSEVRHLRLDVSRYTLCGRRVQRMGGGNGPKDCQVCARKLTAAVNAGPKERTQAMTSANRRVRLEYTSDKWTNLRPGDEGSVTMVDALGTLHIDWDNGSRLGLVPGEDRWTEVA
jgi:xanthine dehydrogenase molybdopterin-binding subunit B